MTKLARDMRQLERQGNYLGRIEGCPIYSFDEPSFHVAFIAKMAIDCDGSGGNPDNDPYYQDDTSLHYKGKAINAQTVPFIVVPPKILYGVEPVVLGCMASVINLQQAYSCQAVTADVGPEKKLGEASCECAERVGLERDSNHGGTDEHIILYILWPGIAAEVDGIKYKLQPS